MSALERLKWDSEFFGYGVGRCEELPGTPVGLAALERVARSRGFRLVVLNFSADQSVPDFLSHSARWRHVDQRVTLGMPVVQACEVPSEVRSWLGRQPGAQLQKLAEASGQHSRFFLDPGFRQNEFVRLYEVWLARSLNGEIADEVLGIERGTVEAGFITLADKAEFAQIGLLAVDERFRGQGIGKRLVRAAHAHAEAKRLPQLKVVTQAANNGAVSFYESCGFRVESVHHTFHGWFDG